MAADGLDSIGTAAGNEAAARPQQRRDPLSVQADQGQQAQGEDALRRVQRQRNRREIKRLRSNR